MAFLAVAAPLAPGIFGITALFLRYILKGLYFCASVVVLELNVSGVVLTFIGSV